MNIEGKLVRLRALEPSDSRALKEMMNDGDMEYMLGGWSFPVSQKAQDDWMDALDNGDKTTLRCGIEDKENGAFLGTVMLTGIDYKNGTGEIHVKRTRSDSRKQGIGTDAICTMVRYAFDELRLNCIFAYVNEHNAASMRMLEKSGFVKEGVLRSRLFKRGQYINVVSLSICARDGHE